MLNSILRTSEAVSSTQAVACVTCARWATTHSQSPTGSPNRSCSSTNTATQSNCRPETPVAHGLQSSKAVAASPRSSTTPNSRRDPNWSRPPPRALCSHSETSRAEQERDAATRVAVAEERARIARELHDIVAHAVSVVVLQVGAVRHQLPDAMAEDRDALRGVEQAGRGALAEMRRLLSVMRRDGDGLELAPQPGLDGLDSLIKDIDRAGLPVELHLDGERVPLPPGIDLSAYRIVQEGPHQRAQARPRHPRGGNRPVCAERGRDRSARRRQRRDAERPPRPRADRHPRARQTLRGRDDRRHDKRRRVHAQHPPPTHPRPAMTIRVLIADD